MIIAILVITAIVFAAIYHARRTRARVAALKRYYEQTLRGTDKRSALDAGRAYHSAMRKDVPLTIYDGQAIHNDLTTTS